MPKELKRTILCWTDVMLGISKQ